MIGTTTGRARTEEQDLRPSLQDPTACQTPPTRCATFLSPTPKGRTSTHDRHQGAQCQIIDVPPLSNPHGTVGHERATWTTSGEPANPNRDQTASPAPVLLRKEVIQPHLPVRLPCYDLVPIASPTFDGSSPYGLGHRLRVLPTFVT
jgi:hypothetical protein